MAYEYAGTIQAEAKGERVLRRLLPFANLCAKGRDQIQDYNMENGDRAELKVDVRPSTRGVAIPGWEKRGTGNIVVESHTIDTWPVKNHRIGCVERAYRDGIEIFLYLFLPDEKLFIFRTEEFYHLAMGLIKKHNYQLRDPVYNIRKNKETGDVEKRWETYFYTIPWEKFSSILLPNYTGEIEAI